MELIAPSVVGSGVDEISLQKQQQGEGKNQTVTKTSNNKRVVVWPEFKVPLPDPVLGKLGFFSLKHPAILYVLKVRFSVAKEL